MTDISQSFIKSMFRKGKLLDYCPKKVYHRYILKEKCTETTLSMLSGIYFENRTLGGELFDLPTKKNGEPTIDTLRIQQQIRNFPGVLTENLLFVAKDFNTQIKLRKKYNEEYDLVGVLDLFPSFILHEGDIKVAIIDLKLTKDLSSTWGDFCWSSESELDWLQGAFYHYLVQNIDWEMNMHLKPSQMRLIQKFETVLNNELCLFLFLIFDYSDPLEHKFIEIEWNYDKLKYLQNSVDKTIHEIEMNNVLRWSTNPNTENCKNCLLNCPDRLLIAKI